MPHTDTPFFDLDICHWSADGTALEILDQTLLPLEERFVQLHSAADVAEAIAKLRVRGAPAIGIAAAMGLCVAVAQGEDFATALHTIGQARPTAVNLSWALRRMERRWLSADDGLRLDALRREAEAIKAEDRASCEAIGSVGANLIKEGMGVLTHCNAGHLATGGLGTALAPLYVAHREGRHFKVYADETRPLLQGARLTAYELHRSGLDVTLACDNMAAWLLSSGRVQLIFVGCDRVAANGDVANKVGTYGLAVLAHHFGVPFYVCGPLSSFDRRCATGADITIEHRSADEVRSLWYARPMAPDCPVVNPAFDVTDHRLVTGYITERGLLTADALPTILQNEN